MQIFNSPAQRRRHYRRVRIKVYSLLGLVGLVATFAFYGFLNLPAFQIKSFEATGSVTAEAVRGRILENNFAKLLGFKHFFAWPNEIDNLKIEKDYSAGILKIISPEPDRFIIWCVASCYWIDKNGVVLDLAPSTEGSAIIKIEDSREEGIAIGKPVLGEPTFAVVKRIVEEVSKLSLGLKKLALEPKSQELVITTAEGPKLYFSLRFQPAQQIFEYIANLIETKKIKTASYIDFTVENRIYLKPR